MHDAIFAYLNAFAARFLFIDATPAGPEYADGMRAQMEQVDSTLSTAALVEIEPTDSVQIAVKELIDAEYALRKAQKHHCDAICHQITKGGDLRAQAVGILSKEVEKMHDALARCRRDVASRIVELLEGDVHELVSLYLQWHVVHTNYLNYVENTKAIRAQLVAYSLSQIRVAELS